MVLINIRYYCINEFSRARVEGMKISKNLIGHAVKQSAMSGLSIPGKIEHWACIGSMVEANPDLPSTFVRVLLEPDRNTRPEKYQCY